jgi:hypothetical protein
MASLRDCAQLLVRVPKWMCSARTQFDRFLSAVTVINDILTYSDANSLVATVRSQARFTYHFPIILKSKRQLIF